MQYIGKLMRSADADAAARGGRRAAARPRARDSLALHEAERWRAELIADDEALTRWHRRASGRRRGSSCAAWCARAQGRRAEPEQRSGRAYRELFQVLKEALGDE